MYIFSMIRVKTYELTCELTKQTVAVQSVKHTANIHSLL